LSRSGIAARHLTLQCVHTICSLSPDILSHMSQHEGGGWLTTSMPCTLIPTISTKIGSPGVHTTGCDAKQQIRVLKGQGSGEDFTKKRQRWCRDSLMIIGLFRVSGCLPSLPWCLAEIQPPHARHRGARRPAAVLSSQRFPMPASSSALPDIHDQASSCVMCTQCMTLLLPSEARSIR
jgi:hypothetical protein